MARNVIAVIMQSDWKMIYALTVVYGYMYNIIAWPVVFWLTTIYTTLTDRLFPAPPLVPYEHLLAATANLAVIGAVQFARDRNDLTKSRNTP